MQTAELLNNFLITSIKIYFRKVTYIFGWKKKFIERISWKQFEEENKFGQFLWTHFTFSDGWVRGQGGGREVFNLDFSNATNGVRD